MLVGSGATEFALNQGFSMEDNHTLLSEMTSRAYEVGCTCNFPMKESIPTELINFMKLTSCKINSESMYKFHYTVKELPCEINLTKTHMTLCYC